MLPETIIPRPSGARGKARLDLYSAFLSEVAVGEIRSGERLSEERLAARWRVGRVPVRETFLRLEQDGFVVRRPGSGTYLRELDEREVGELYDIRIGVEPLVTREAARLATANEVDELIRLAERADILGAPPHELEAGDRAFHGKLCQISRLRHAERIVTLARQQLRCFTLFQRIAFLGRYTISKPDHRPIAAAIRLRDGERAAAQMVDHLRGARQATLHDLEEIKARLEKARLHAGSEDGRQPIT